MVIGIGCDIVSHVDTESLKWEENISLLKRAFSSNELNIYNSQEHEKIKFISGRFAAKEAVLKCLGTGMQDGLSLNEIQILREESGKPKIFLSGEVEKISLKMEISSWQISITHTSNYSLAFAVAEKLG